MNCNTFIEYCRIGNINGIKCLSLKDCDLDKGFREACYYGHYIVVIYLVELYKNDPIYNKINIHSWDEFGFRWACRNGHYIIVKYLVELCINNNDYNKIKIHYNHEEGFRFACFWGHFKIVKYLVELYKTGNLKKYYKMINIHENRDEGFIFNYYTNKCPNIIKYLMILYKKHKHKHYYPIKQYLIIFNKFDKFKY